ncbi:MULTISPECIES: hypothetical protein [Acinetobacter]|jgi:hypothetical protein|uniref:Uncharacterized protein n=2 Tax=Acinetobacter beijerinckii TaxID=262668 RepID=N9E1F5_9GAMM|nr:MULTISPECIES: hypothetical protein [Acinetobacter]ENW03781.1 hypothetical protein F933_02751 [Acinetobacter beijerinckii CIP 110307]ENW03957.1 hypothetical protein F934_01993 [Acinetobacter beijerinckii ANC 3835]MDF2417178.1 hypothetical protein [Acinetobacter beijerinckii]UTO20834.1 hypothetical protein NGC85_07080 [Acinetobacter sp. Z1]
MEKKQHHYTSMGVILFTAVLPLAGWAVQPLAEGSLALQTGVLNNALPRIIEKAEQDAQKPLQERWLAQKVLSDRNLREIRINMLAEGALSPYEEQKKTAVSDGREKKKATMKPHDESPDRFMIYEFDSPNIKRSKITYR